MKMQQALRLSRVRSALAGALLALAALAPFARAADDIVTFDRWYALELQGQRAGWMHAQTTQCESGLITSRTEIEIRVGRADMFVTVAVNTEFVESKSGEPVSMMSMQKLGQIPVTTHWFFRGDSVIEEVHQGDEVKRRGRALPEGEWLTPAAASRYVDEQLDAGATEIVYSSIDPSAGLQVIENKGVVKGPTTVEAYGKSVPATEWVVTQSVMPGVAMHGWVDDDGQPVRAEMNLGGIKMTILASEKEAATSNLTAAEMLVESFVTPDRPIDSPRRVKRAAYVVSLSEGDLPDLPSTGSQRVERIDSRSARVTIVTDSFQFCPADAAQAAECLASSTMINGEDSEIVAFVERVLEGNRRTSRASTAEALRQAVYAHVEKKNLGVGFATASEVCRTRQGDCTEHAVLLAAALRAAGIPARVASGVIYADAFAGREKIFGYHMWTQALLDVNGKARWVDLDATLKGDTAYDATHITLGVSPLGETDTINSMATLAPILGRLQIKVEKTD